MRLEEAGRKLKGMYESALHGEKVAHIHLFGIKYADELDGLTSMDIVRQAGLRESYNTEVAKGRKLAKYVRLKQTGSLPPA